ncbi:hypothetical protein J2D73_11635 [Acetobacter sacchari]|uniref:Uncharacterized protein n=1 Tax=Acetobacter sacchari TaxID=2661687 RepID=A0ABS3LWZ1_9PROT|nr:hypothetical protein [Acetobacter sacchari]MBO1360439.1 hypothetical protein [Acetobacter sacchari]
MPALTGLAAIAAPADVTPSVRSQPDIESSTTSDATFQLDSPLPVQAPPEANLRDAASFVMRIPSEATSRAAQIDNSLSLGDRVLAGLCKIGSSFGKLDALAPQILSPNSVPSSTGAATGPERSTTSTGENPSLGLPAGGASGLSGSHDKDGLYFDGALKSVVQQGAEMYRRSIELQVQFANAEFETHVITVASQNMSSTLKSLLSEGG